MYKNWKDKDRFTARDYTYERDITTSRLQALSENIANKVPRKFILQNRTPYNVLEGNVWMDPTNSVQEFITPASLLIKHKIDIEGEIHIKPTATLEIEHNITLGGRRFTERDFVRTYIDHNITIGGDVQTHEHAGVNDTDITGTMTSSGSAQIHIRRPASVLLDSDLSLDATAIFHLKGGASYDIDSTLTAVAEIQVSLNGEAATEIDSTLTLDVETQPTIKDKPSQTNIQYTISLGADAEQNKENTPQITTIDHTITLDASIVVNYKEKPQTITIDHTLTIDAIGIESYNDSPSPTTIDSTLSITGESPAFVTLYGKSEGYAGPVVSVSINGNTPSDISFSSGDPGTVIQQYIAPLENSIQVNAPSPILFSGGQATFSQWKHIIDTSPGVTNTVTTSTNPWTRTIQSAYSYNQFVVVYTIQIEQPIWAVVANGSGAVTPNFFVQTEEFTDSAVLAAVTTSYPPANYPYGEKHLVNCYDLEGAYFGQKYVQRLEGFV